MTDYYYEMEKMISQNAGRIKRNIIVSDILIVGNILLWIAIAMVLF